MDEKRGYLNAGGDFISREADLEKVKDRLAAITGVEFVYLGNKYRDLWRSATKDDAWIIEVQHNFDAETEEFAVVKHRDDPTYISVLDHPDMKGLCDAITADPVIKGICTQINEVGDEIPLTRREELQIPVSYGFFGIDSEDLEEMAEWLKSRFNIPLERFDSPQWGPYYTVFDPSPDDTWVGGWDLWFTKNPLYPDALSDEPYQEWPLILRVSNPLDYATTRKALLEEAPIDVGALEEYSPGR